MSDCNSYRVSFSKPYIFGWLAAITLIVAPLALAQEREPDQDAPQAAQAQRPATQPTTRPASDARDERLAQLESQLRDALHAVETMRGSEPAAQQPTAPTPAPAAPMPPKISLDSKWINAMSWRSIGPAGMGGRIVDFAVVRSDPSTYWVATASGGLLKTVNNGMSFVHQFDHEATVSIGCVAVARSDSNIVWVGTGENNPRNSVSYGDGVYKSIDGGRTWKNMGLKKTFQIGRIQIHPQDPNIVYVGALGRLYGYNEERGVYKTTDGGETWKRVLFTDDRSGVIDMRMQPDDPESLIVAMWDRKRDGFDSHPGGQLAEGVDGYDPLEKWGNGSGLFKTTDGGKNWHRLSKGLPSSNLGRVGLDFYGANPHEVFAIIDCAKIGMGKAPPQVTPVYLDLVGEEAEGGVKLSDVRADGPSAKAGLMVDDIIQTINDQPVIYPDEMLDTIREHKIGDKLKIKVSRGGQVLEFEVTLIARQAGAFGGRGGRGGGGGGGGRGGRGGAAAQPTGPYAGLTGEDAQGAVRLSSVVEEGPAERAGLRAGDIVNSVSGKKIESYEQLVEELQAHQVGDKVEFKIRRGEEDKDIDVTLVARPQVAGGGGGRGGAGAGGGGTLGAGPSGSAVRPNGGIYAGQMPNLQDTQGDDGYEYGGIYKSVDAGESWTRINSLNPRPMYFSLLRVDPSNDQNLFVGGVDMYKSTDGGKTFRANAGRGVHADQHAMWIDPRDGRHMLVGCDGGFYVSYDRSRTWDHLNNMAIGQFYHIAIRNVEPYWVIGGLQDNGSWGGPTISLDGQGPINEDWISVGGGDGFQCAVDWNDPNVVYSESQDGAITRRNLRTGERAAVRPQRAQGAPAYHFNWNTPFILSHHNSRILFSAGDYVFRSLDRGNDMRAVSPRIAVTPDGTGTALAESPLNPDVLYAGTDDGALWVTRDGCKTWTNVAANVGLPGPRWVATIEASRYAPGRAYAVFDAHRSDDDEPYVSVTEDYGRTWRSLRGNLPWGSTRCMREDISNANVLYLGTEFGAWVSLDRGQSWNKMGGNLPTVDVHEFAQHPTNGEIVAATHGRSLWVMDVSPLRQVRSADLAENPQLYQPPAFVRWHSEPSHAGTNRRFMGTNPTFGAQIYYSLPKNAENVTLKILDISGATLREFPAKKEAGLYHVTWNLQPQGNGPGGGRGGFAGPTTGPTTRPTTIASTQATTEPTTQPAGRGRGGGRFGARGGGRGARGGGRGAAGIAAGGEAAAEPGAPAGAAAGGGGDGRGGFGRIATAGPGSYRIVLTVDGKDYSRTLRIDPDPVVSDSVVMASNSPDLGQDEEEREKREAMGLADSDEDQHQEAEEQREREREQEREMQRGGREIR